MAFSAFKNLLVKLAGSGIRFPRINADHTTDELTAAQMLAALGHQLKVCAADVTRITSGGDTLAIDSTLQAPVVAGTAYRLRIMLWLNATTKAPKLNIKLSTGSVGIAFYQDAINLATSVMPVSSVTTITDNNALLDGTTDAEDHFLQWEGTFTAAATGTVAVWWAASSTASSVAVMKANSSLELTAA